MQVSIEDTQTCIYHTGTFIDDEHEESEENESKDSCEEEL